MSEPREHFWFGLDLGQSADPTALSIVSLYHSAGT
jgi:hypothetical protein